MGNISGTSSVWVIKRDDSRTHRHIYMGSEHNIINKLLNDWK